MALSTTASIKQSFNANLAPIMSQPLETRGAAFAVAQDSVQKAPELAGNIEMLQGALGNANTNTAPAGGSGFNMGVVGAVGFAAAAIGGPVGAAVNFGATVVQGIQSAMSGPKEEPTQFASYADLQEGQDIMDFENDMLLNGTYTTCLGDTSDHGGIMRTASNMSAGVGAYDPNLRAPALAGTERKEAEKALGAMEKQFKGLHGENEAAQKFAEQDQGMGGLPGGLKLPGTMGTGWSPPVGMG